MFSLRQTELAELRQPPAHAAAQSRRRRAEARTARASRWSVGLRSAHWRCSGCSRWPSRTLTALPHDAERSRASCWPGQRRLANGSPTALRWRRWSTNWPRFRGPGGNGVLDRDTNLPLTWDHEDRPGIAWKSEVPVAGFNSPIVWGDRVFLSGGDAAKREVVCYRHATGELLWRRAVENVAGSPAQLRRSPNKPAMRPRPWPPTAGAFTPSSPTATWPRSPWTASRLGQEPRLSRRTRTATPPR